MACFDMRGVGILSSVFLGKLNAGTVRVLVLFLVFVLSGCKPVAVITVDRESGDAPIVVNFDALRPGSGNWMSII